MGQRKRAGQRLSLAASDWNDAMQAAEMILGGKMNRRDNTLSVRRGNQDVLVKNTTGATLPQFSIVGLAAVNPTPAIITEFLQQNHVFNGVTIAVPDHLGKWAITQEPLVANAVGTARTAGIAIAKVVGANESMYGDFCEILNGDSVKLERNANGSAQILWKDSGTDWCVIRIGNVPNETLLFKSPSGGMTAATGSGPWTPGAATCKLCERYLSGATVMVREVSPAVDIVVHNSIPAATKGDALGQGKWIHGKRFVDVIECA